MTAEQENKRLRELLRDCRMIVREVGYPKLAASIDTALSQQAEPAPAQDGLMPDEIHQMAFEEGQPAENGDGYCFTAEEFDLFVERLLSRANRPAQTEQSGLVEAAGAVIRAADWWSANEDSPKSALAHFVRAADALRAALSAPIAQTAPQPEQSKVDTFELPELGRGLNPLDASGQWIQAYRAATGLTLAEAREEGRRRRAALSAQGADEQ